MYEHNALGYRSGLALCLTKVRSSRARCPATALIYYVCFISFSHSDQSHIFAAVSVVYAKKNATIR